MATEEHTKYANIIKEVHEDLRRRSKVIGSEKAWEEHLMDTKRLTEYSKAMRALAAIWEENSARVEKESTQKMFAHSRVKWIINFLNSYFFTERIYLNRRERELRILESWFECSQCECKYLDNLQTIIRVLDVGSCFNPMGHVAHFDVTAIDICPASDDVFRGDFLKIAVEEVNDFAEIKKVQKNNLETLPREYFECVVFSLLLEYMPSSQQRIECCRKAYELLLPEGILVIITPDSQNVGKNATLMKNWQYTLATLGFMRIKFEKLPHITCMVFRKVIDARLAHRWAEIHRLDKRQCKNMSVAIEIPQDKNC